MTYSYDTVGLRRAVDAAGAGRFTTTFDVAGSQASERTPFGERTTFSYDNGGRRTVQRNPDGTRVSYVYDSASQTTQVIHRNAAGTTQQQLEYRYDSAGNRIVMIEGSGAARVTWSYDKQNQLTGEYRTGTNAYRQTFTYDTGGNRTLKNIDATRTTYAYDSANQLKYGQAGTSRTTCVYDANGNQQIEQPAIGNRRTTTWNYENQPTLYRLPAGSRVTMIYNGDNRRAEQQKP
jgi:YD repeat-containing protein